MKKPNQYPDTQIVRRAFNMFWLVSLMLFGGTSIKAQDTLSHSKSRIQLSEIQVLFGPVREVGEYISHNEFKQLAPQSPIHNLDLSGYSSKSNGGRSLHGQLSLLAGIKYTPQNKKFNSVFRIGIMHSPRIEQTYELLKSQTVPFDTLSSGSSGRIIYINETNYERVYMGYRANYVSADLSLTLQTETNRRFQFMAGLGFTIGMTLNAQTIIGTSSFYNYNATDNQGSTIMGFSYSSSKAPSMTSEYYKNKNHAVISAYIPLGFNIRIGQLNEVLSNLFLSYECRPSLVSYQTEINKRYFNLLFPNLFGLKYKWN